MKRGILILLACCPCAFALNPSLDISQYARKSWTIREGFFKSGVGSITQTPDGYLWLATYGGDVVRFDGVRFVPWRPPTGETLPDDIGFTASGRTRWAPLDWHAGRPGKLEGR